MTTTEISQACNRHIARTMSGLEEADCPKVYSDYVRSQMQWLRADLTGEFVHRRHGEDDHGDEQGRGVKEGGAGE